MDDAPQPDPDATGPRDRVQPARPRFESYAERQVREAIERGEFDNLPGAGRPLPGLDGRHDPDWWIKRKLADEDLRAVLPPPLALRREAQEIQRTLDDVGDEATARAIVDDLNARITAANARQTTRVAVVTRRVNVEQVLDEWRARRRPR